jgi:hypothetical protein
MAYEHGLNFVFSRVKDRVNLVLYQYGAEPEPVQFEGAGL